MKDLNCLQIADSSSRRPPTTASTIMNEFLPDRRNIQIHRRRKYFLLLLTIFALPLLTFVIVKGGYCSSWWGRDNLFLRALWLCSCSEEFEQSLYPDHVEVMYSACNHVQVLPLPDTQYMQVFGDDQFVASERYILDNATGDKIPLILPDNLIGFDFLPQELVVIYLPDPERKSTYEGFILNWKSNEMVQLRQLDITELPFAYLGQALIDQFRRADTLFVYPGDRQVIGLTSNWGENTENNFMLYTGNISGREPGWLQELVIASGVPYHELPLPADSIILPDGGLMADYTGVYEVDSGKQIVSSFQLPGIDGGYYPCCWLPQENAVVYTFQDRTQSSLPHNNWYNLGSPGKDRYGFWMPVLKIKLP